ncbi:MAG TPA: glycosyltransferase [Chloroflexota bacterium]|nr:glycosyltransferase [Chloroflexota bacterium]
MRVLLVSHPVGPLGTGIGGGVELTLQNAATALRRRGHQVLVLAPSGSRFPSAPLIEVPGALQPSAQYEERDAPIAVPAHSVLANLWEQARLLQGEHEVILNFAYDWLPLYLTPFFSRPVAHIVSMSSLLDAMDAVIEQVARAYPDSIAMHTRAQAQTFGFAEHCRIIGNGLDLDLYPFGAAPARRLCWVGRIAPEKGLEDAAAVAQATGLPLDIFGLVQDQRYWQRIQQEFAGAPLHYHGFLATAELAQAMSQRLAFLMTPKWTEAFGNVVMEALACGLPVIAYRRGGPAEIVEDGRTGWLVEPDSVDGLIDAVSRVNLLDRAACRAQAARDFSLEAFGLRLERWLSDLVSRAG